MSAGPKKFEVEFQRSTPVQDESGQELDSWAPLGRAWAGIFWGLGAERRQAAAEQASQAATFQVYSNPTTQSVGVKDRLTITAGAIALNTIWDITGIAFPKTGEIEFTATSAV